MNQASNQKKNSGKILIIVLCFLAFLISLMACAAVILPDLLEGAVKPRHEIEEPFFGEPEYHHEEPGFDPDMDHHGGYLDGHVEEPMPGEGNEWGIPVDPDLETIPGWDPSQGPVNPSWENPNE